VFGKQKNKQTQYFLTNFSVVKRAISGWYFSKKICTSYFGIFFIKDRKKMFKVTQSDLMPI